MNNSRTIELGSKYQHYKDPSHIYKALMFVKDSKNAKEMIIYQALYDNPDGIFWATPVDEFLEYVEKPFDPKKCDSAKLNVENGELIPRFKLMD